MIWIFIDTHERGTVVYGVLGQPSKIRSYAGRGNLLIHKLSQLIQRQDISKLSGVCVVQGPGPFSSIRIGVLIANILARSLSLPLYPVTVDQTLDHESLHAFLMHGKIKSVKYVAPEYDQDPNITLPKAV